jgi:hypothetical protein
VAKRDGHEDNEEPSVDEGRGRHAESARGPADEDNGDRAQAQAERGRGVFTGIKAGRDAGWRSRGKGRERGLSLSRSAAAARHVRFLRSNRRGGDKSSWLKVTRS